MLLYLNTPSLVKRQRGNPFGFRTPSLSTSSSIRVVHNPVKLATDPTLVHDLEIDPGQHEDRMGDETGVSQGEDKITEAAPIVLEAAPIVPEAATIVAVVAPGTSPNHGTGPNQEDDKGSRT
jgi:hypothetical protein